MSILFGQQLVALTAGLLLVLLLRRGLRRLFGAGSAFWLWLLPPLSLLGAALPVSARWPVAPLHYLSSVPAFAGPASSNASLTWLVLIWAAGVGVAVLRLALAHRRLHRALQPCPPSLAHALADACDPIWLPPIYIHSAGPAMAPSLHGMVLLLPADFLQRFDPTQRRLILRHEHTHLRRGDVLWNVLAELALALLWFHPLAWLARPRFRIDQELACDEALLRKHPASGGRYAHTLLHGVLPRINPAPITGVIPWLSEPTIKERLIMIKRQQPGTLRRCAGLVTIALLLVSGVVLAHGSTQAATASASK